MTDRQIALSQRISELERQVQSQRRLLMAMVVGLLGALGIAGKSASRIEAQEILITDGGKVRAKLGMVSPVRSAVLGGTERPESATSRARGRSPSLVLYQDTPEQG